MSKIINDNAHYLEIKPEKFKRIIVNQLINMYLLDLIIINNDN